MILLDANLSLYAYNVDKELKMMNPLEGSDKEEI